MLSAARRVQAYWPSRAEIRKATWFSGAVEEAGPSVGHALLPPLPSRPCAPLLRDLGHVNLPTFSKIIWLHNT
ncbi:unnamed protein product [Rangifer tarandus platyrhynchus]|uniref:Uncharacterized protein n=2 Tax=Rangifer tarandus platyrhynchus TaxID=3082113 RepID=A0ACB0ERH4_RANTA|nr:unnamed protein product [Rangifer tarandus platyrhynchus]CAI9702873.1 unnamed protein product [Rangifer tarandus platyrhynchus]